MLKKLYQFKVRSQDSEMKPTRLSLSSHLTIFSFASNKKQFFAGVLALSLFTSVLVAEDREGLFSIGAGFFNISGHHKRYLFQAEYKAKPFFYELRTQVGFFVTELTTTYFYAGVAYDLLLGHHFVITPSFSPGLYFKGNGKELGLPVEFRSALECAYRFECMGRLGAMVYHLSNASLGYKNPGVNALAFFYSIPWTTARRKKSN